MSAASDYPKLAEDAFNRRDLDALSFLWAPDFVYEGPGGERSHTREEARERELALWDGFPDLRADLSRHFASGDRLVIEGVMRGRHDGTLRLGDAALAPSGRVIELGFVGVFSFAHGLVAFERVVYDRLELLQQLGALPERAAP